MRKYRKDASGLRAPVVWTEIREPEEPFGESVFRLAWLFVEGWRHELRKAGDMIEKARWEWEIDGTTTTRPHSRASSLALMSWSRMLACGCPRRRTRRNENRCAGRWTELLERCLRITGYEY